MVIQITETNTEFINNHISIARNYKETADNLINGKLRLLKESDIIDFDKVPNWNYKHSISSNTYQLYLHTLNFTKSLVKSFAENKEIKYISLAKNIIENWIKINLNQIEKVNYAWYDHTVSSRIQNLLFFQVNAPNEFKIDKKLFKKVFEKHVEFLSKYKNYTENNHGIMMDRALLLSAIFYDNEETRLEYIMLAKNRVEKAILRDYSYNSTHLENSPDYHRMVTNWLLAIVKIFEEVKIPLSNKYKLKLEHAINYNGIIINYNNEYPMIGDTSHGVSKIKKLDDDFIDYEAGIAVINDSNTFSTLVFNCGFQNLTHKHYDDLSFTLSIDREQIFVDSGKYNYSKKDPIRQYMISPKAHTTFLVQNRSYPLKYGENIKIISSYNNGDYKIVKGRHEGYHNIILERTIVYLKDGIYIIIDKANSSEENIYVQNFVLDNEVKLDIEDKRKYKITTENNKQYTLQEHSKIASAKLFKGEKANAMISKKFNILEDTTRLEIRKKQKNSNFLTTLSPIELNIESIVVEENFVSIAYNDTEMNIKLI